MEPPRKRQKLSPSPPTSTPVTTSHAHEPPQDTDTTMAEAPHSSTSPGISVSSDIERSVGILQFVNAKNPGFTGILKQRQVNIHVT